MVPIFVRDSNLFSKYETSKKHTTAEYAQVMTNPKDEVSVFVISLERSVERRRRVAEMLESLKVKFTIFPAIDGSALSPQELELYSSDLAVKKAGRELVAGEIGCYLSHLRLWESIGETGIQNALILEDDAEIGSAAVNIIHRRRRLPPDWETVNFLSDTQVLVQGDPIWDIHRVGEYAGWANRASTYLVNSRGVEKLVKAALPIALAADGLTGRVQETGLRLYGVYPPAAGLFPTSTTIIGREDIRIKRKALHKVLNSFRKFTTNR